MLNGIIIVKKESGFTSNDVVAKMRGICKQKKIGHTGTLDPDATGVLPVCLGTGTKLCDMLTERDKEYVAELLKTGVSDDDFQLAKKSVYGMCISSLNRNENIAGGIMECGFSDREFFDYIECVKNAALDDINNRLRSQFDVNACSLSVILPL